MADAVTLLGAGGSKFVFGLPLRANFVKQVERGQLRPASDSDAAALAGAEPEPTEEAPGASDGEVERPPGNGSIDVWRAYADHVGVAVDDDATRNEIRDAVKAAGL